MLDSQRIRDLISEATAATEGMQEPLRTAAFQTVLQWLLSQNAQGPAPVSERTGHSRQAAATAPILNEFVSRLAVATHLDRIEAILYHNLRYGDNDRMTRDELLEAYGRLRERRPANVSDLLAKCIRRGHIIDAPEPKDGRRAWQITPTGERHVEQLQAGE